MQLRFGHLIIHTVSRSRVGIARPHAIEDVGARPLRASLVGQCEVQESNGPDRIRFATKNWAYADVVNLVSHPLFTAVLVPIAQRVVAPVAAVLIGEVIVCALEAGMLIAWLRRDPLVVIAVTLIANGCSFAAGLLWFSTVQPFP